MKLVLQPEDFDELQVPLREFAADTFTDSTYQTVYGGMTRTRRVLTLGEGLSIAHTTIQTERNLIIQIDNPNAGMEMHINMEGYAESRINNKSVGFAGAQHNQLFFAGFKERIYYAAQKTYSCLEIDCWPLTDLRDRLAYLPEVLDENIARVESGESFTLGQPRSITFSQRQIIDDLLHCSVGEPYRRMYLEAKVWELYALQADQFKQAPVTAFKISASDLDKLHHVRDLLTQSIDNPGSLLELARQTGLNLDKLKRGFKAVFGTTVFGYLHELRMHKAYRLLVEGHHSIAEIAVLVGYKNPQHFTAAFRKQFGDLPSALRK
jgi:AraC-like DNA-binding protein